MATPSRISAGLLPAVLALSVFLSGPAAAHPLPDVLVRSFFNTDGSAVIRIELDPRSFTEDPLNEPYVENGAFGEMTAEERAAMVDQANHYVENAVEIRFLPHGKIEPDFQWRFTGHDDRPLEKADDPVMLTGEWEIPIPADLEGYQVHAHDYRTLSVYFLNHLRNVALEDYQVMFPGETSKVLDLKNLVAEIPEANLGPPLRKRNTGLIVGLAVAVAVIPILILTMLLLKRRIES